MEILYKVLWNLGDLPSASFSFSFCCTQRLVWDFKLWQKLSPFFPLGTPLDYTSQPPLQVGVVLWLSSNQWNTNGNWFIPLPGMTHKIPLSDSQLSLFPHVSVEQRKKWNLKTEAARAPQGAWKAANQDHSQWTAKWMKNILLLR